VAISTVAHVRTQSNTVGSARLLLLIIASHISPTSDLARPSVPTLARESRLSVRHTYRLIHRLEAMGELEVIRRQGRVNLYRVKLSTASSYLDPTPDSMPSQTRDVIAAPKSLVKEDIALTHLGDWLTPGSRIWCMLTEDDPKTTS
jgi:hypothetical protein